MLFRVLYKLCELFFKLYDLGGFIVLLLVSVPVTLPDLPALLIDLYRVV